MSGEKQRSKAYQHAIHTTAFMRILYVSPSYYPHVGGVEYVVKSVAERLVKRGHDVTVLAGRLGYEKPVKEEVNGVHVVRWPVWSPGGAYHVPRMRGRFKEYLRGVARGFDVIHFHSVHSVFTMHALNMLKDVGVRKVLTMHYHGTGHTLFRRLLWVPWRGFCRKLVRYIDVVHAVSVYEARLIERDFGVKPVVIEHGVEERLASVEWRPENYVMYSGRIERYKNLHRLGNIVKVLNNVYGYNLQLKIFGAGSYRDKLGNYLEKLGISFSIDPPQPYEKYIESLSRAKLFALLSEREAFGQTVNEANAIGVPAVVAEPWGRNFEDRPRTLIVSLKDRDEEIASKVAEFLDRVAREPRSSVPTWDEVADTYIKRLYRT
ncbi:MAG: glycosyltransferase family 4 protein [Ignisphaera sp.]|uniref:glycosyltransferase family 4 protein n=1 Tax=Desulfurococcus sp. TaxID=51678 RepID=UPI003162B0DB